MSRFDEKPDGDIHGECAFEIENLTAEIAALLEEIKALRSVVTARIKDAKLSEDYYGLDGLRIAQDLINNVPKTGETK